jgi:uncharacterized protein (DUF1697 family)
VAIPRRVAFVRAIMIGRDGLHRELVLDLFRDAGAIEPRNHLATGNISFTALSADIPAIAARVEACIEAIVGRPKPLYVRALDHLQRLVADDPFRDAPFESADREVVFLPPDPLRPDLPLVSRSGRTSVFASNGSELFAVCQPDEGPGALAERALGAPVTVRAWSTIQKIVAAHVDAVSDLG